MALPLLSRRKKEKGASKKPENTDLKQQRLKAWTPVMTPWNIVMTLGLIGIIFGIVGGIMLANAGEEVVIRKQYDGSGTDDELAGCHIEVADAGTECQVTVRVDKKMKPPIHEIDNFYQNHRRYVKSLSWAQLYHREVLREDELKDSECSLLYENGTKFLNPCGLIPNTLFNDVLLLTAPNDIQMKEKNIAWHSDVRDILKTSGDFAMGRAFDQMTVANSTDACFTALSSIQNPIRCAESTCRLFDIESKFYDDCYGYVCQGSYYDEFKCVSGELVVYHYDRLDKWQYLFQTFPQTISPLVGPNSEHFAVWIRVHALPRFRKLYGRISTTIDKDTDIVFTVSNNFDVHSFDGKKFIVLATGDLSFAFIANAYIAVAALCLAGAIIFAALQSFRPRRMGDPKYIPWLNDQHRDY